MLNHEEIQEEQEYDVGHGLLKNTSEKHLSKVYSGSTKMSPKRRSIE
jgi:hypothetical protein